MSRIASSLGMIHSNRVRTSAVLCLLACIGIAPASARQDEPTGERITNSICPVMEDEPIDPEFFVDVDEKTRISFCCKKCVRLYSADPAKYAGAVARVMPASFQAPEQQAPAPAPGAPTTPQNPVDASQAGAGPLGAAQPSAPPAVSFLTRIGRFHIVALHFPLAFLVGAAGLDLFCASRRKARGPSYGAAVVRTLAWFGAITAIVSMTLGLLLEASVEHRLANMPDDLALLDLHKWSGIVAAALACIALLLIELRERKRGFGSPWPATIALLLTACAIGATGHFGGSLVWGPDFLLPWK